MLHLISSIWSAVTETEETKILFLGSSNSGKSALFERFKLFLEHPNDEEEPSEKSTEETKSNLGGLASLKLEMEKRKLEEQKRLKENNNQVDDDDDNDAHQKNSSLDDFYHREEQNYKNKKILPLPKITTTVGLNVGRGNCVIPQSGKKVSALLWDVGGDPAIRQLWFTYIVQCHGVVFTIDLSASPQEQANAVKLLHVLMLRPELAFAPFLIVGTKMDQVVIAKRSQERQARKNNGAVHEESKKPQNFLHQTMNELHRLLRFEDLPSVAEFLNNDLTTSSSSSSETHEKKPSSADDNGFVPVNVHTLLAADAIDAVSAVPSGSVSGICGHMYHLALGNSQTLKYGTDLRSAMYWILSAAASSRARKATLENLEANLSGDKKKVAVVAE
jgi:GTPase SAR1 family protein